VGRGDKVAAGQLLVELESEVAKANLELAKMRASASAEMDSARLRLGYADATHDRSVALASKQVISPQELDQASSTRELAAAALRRAEEERVGARLEYGRARAALEERMVRSPLAARVVARHFDVGEYVEGQPILELAQLDPLHVEVFVPARLWSRLAVGQEASVLPEEPVGGERTARITLIDPMIDSRSGTFAVRLELPNPDHALPAGLGCRVRFALTPGR
jgi:RND family efflux transporter MFP subunit